MKICSKCDEAKPASDFNRRAASLDGLAPLCKVCDRAYKLGRRDCINQVKRAWVAANRVRVYAQNAEWRCDNGYVNPVNDWGKRTPGKINANTAHRRACKKQATPRWSETGAIQQLYREARALTDSTGVVHHVDHIVPLQHKLVRGLHCLANLRVIPASENHRKSNVF